MEIKKPLAQTSNEPPSLMPIHLESEVHISEKNKNDKPVEVVLKRGYDTVMDFSTGEMPDPKHLT